VRSQRPTESKHPILNKPFTIKTESFGAWLMTLQEMQKQAMQLSIGDRKCLVQALLGLRLSGVNEHA
jgi:hypothetical protein